VPQRQIRITHRSSGLVIAEGPTGWGIMPFEGNFYIRRKYLRTNALASSWIPGLCPYKGLYVWLDLRVAGNKRDAGLGWFYWLPNPLLPFIWFRVAVSGSHPDLVVEEVKHAKPVPDSRPGVGTKFAGCGFVR
jgi:uncharacterized protein (DUF427 family)